MLIIIKELIFFMGLLCMNVDLFLNYIEKEVWEVFEKCYLKFWIESFFK